MTNQSLKEAFQTMSNKVLNILDIVKLIGLKSNSHIDDFGNPHNVTASQIGAASSQHTHDDRYYTESEIDNYNLITTSEIDNICQIPVANIDIDYGDCSSDISFEEAKSYIENFGRLYVYVTGIDDYEKKVNWVNTIHTLENNNTQINIRNNNTGVYMSWYIKWTSSQLKPVRDESIPM